MRVFELAESIPAQIPDVIERLYYSKHPDKFKKITQLMRKEYAQWSTVTPEEIEQDIEAKGIDDFIDFVSSFEKAKHGYEPLKTTTMENFADGKKKGKSKPGRVKQAGASCDGSVTSLRKKAKNSSGEKSKMFHWCANMKSGKNKNK